MRLGVLDVGSNTVHLLVVDARPGAPPVPAFSDKTEMRLAELLDASGRIGSGELNDTTDLGTSASGPAGATRGAGVASRLRIPAEAPADSPQRRSGRALSLAPDGLASRERRSPAKL